MEDTTHHSYRSHLSYLIGLLPLVILIGLPLLKGKLTGGHDSIYYLPRIVEFVVNLRAGELIPRWAPDLSSGLGQPFFIFNPPFLYYLSAIFNLLGSGLTVSHNLALLTILLLAALGMYLLASNIYGPRGGFVAALAYITAPYLLVNLYVRAAWSDFAAFAWIPFVFWGVYRYATDGSYRFLLIGSFATALLVLSSNHISLIAIPFILIMIFWITFSHRRWSVLWRGLLCLFFGLGLSSFFLLPALLEKEYVHVERELESGGFNYWEHFLYPHQWLSSVWDYGGSVPGPKDEMSFAIGPIHLLMVAACILLLPQIWKSSKRSGWWLSFMLFLLLAALFFTLPVSSFIWERLPIVQNLQFPWRFLSLVAVASSFIVGFPFVMMTPDKKHISNVLMISLIAGLLLYSFPKAHPLYFHDSKDSDLTPEKIASGDVKVNIFNMFEPKWAEQDPDIPPGTTARLRSNQGNLTASRISPTHLHIVAALSAVDRVRVFLHYYPGWVLFVDGEEQPFMFDNQSGLIDFELEPGTHSVDLIFIDTPTRKASELLSLISFLLLIGLCAAGLFFKQRNIPIAILGKWRASETGTGP